MPKIFARLPLSTWGAMKNMNAALPTDDRRFVKRFTLLSYETMYSRWLIWFMKSGISTNMVTTAARRNLRAPIKKPSSCEMDMQVLCVCV